MKALYPLIQSLTKSEKRIIRESLVCFSSRKQSNTKTLKLFDYLASQKELIPNNKECAVVIYGNARDKRIKMLKSRLKQKILESMILDFNLTRDKLFDAADDGTIRIRKKISQLFHLYYSKGFQPVLDNILNEIISISKKYESYAPLIEALRFRKYSKGFCKGEDDFNKINEEIAFYELCNQAVCRANDYYYRLIMRTDFHAKTDKDKMKVYLNESILEMRRDFGITRSPLVGYCLKLLEMAYYENSNNYLLALESCRELLTIVKENKSVYRKSRLSLVHGNLCQLNIHLQQYGEALTNVRVALDEISLSHANYLPFKELEFYALFFDKKINESEILINWLLEKNSKIQGHEFRDAKYRFYYANILFFKGQHKNVLKELNAQFEISKDKEGWGTSIRLLTIMTMIELDRFDEVEDRIENLRKHLERNTKTAEREKIILKLLQVLEKSGFNPIESNENEKAVGYLKLLESNDSVYKWQPFGAELIPFHDWVKTKFFKRKSRKIVSEAG